MSVFALLLLAQAPSVPVRTPPSRDIVVTGHRLKDTEAALKACLDRHCPPDQDIAATLAHAENEFVSGDYRAARETISASRGRNKRFAKAYPVPVSDLLRAGGRVAAHLGEGDDFEIYTIDSLEALKAGLPAGDPRVLEQRIEVGDMFAHLGRPRAALDIYHAVAKQAHRLDVPVMEGAARLRVVVLGLSAAEQTLRGSGDRREALAELDALAKERNPKLEAYAFVARIMSAQYAARQGDPKPLDAIMSEIRARGGGTRPILVYSEPIKLVTRPNVDSLLDDGESPLSRARNVLTRRPIDNFDKQWIDVSFWIKPDGLVSDVQIIRQSASKSGEWDKPVLTSVQSRRYAPLALPPGDPGVIRVERYTYTSNFDPTATGTHLRVRDGEGRVVMLDLTDTPDHSADRSASAPTS